MKVLLCQGYLGSGSKTEQLVFPLGLSYIASSLKGHELQCWDPNVHSSDYLGDFTKQIESFNPDVIGISLRNIDNPMIKNRSYVPFFESLVHKAKETLPSCKLVAGGAGFSIFPTELMQLNKEIDAGVFSEGEETFVDLLNNLEQPEKVKGLYLRKDDKITFTGYRPLTDFASMDAPCREFFEVDKYKNPAAIGIQTKRGCKYNCIYCLHRYYMGSRYRLRSPKQVVDEVENLQSNHGIDHFYFADPVFNYPFEHAREICKEILRRNLQVSWEACFRPDFINRAFLKEALDSGCRLFDFSPDGASDNALRILGKSLSVECIRKSVDLVSEFEDIKVAYEFMSSVPNYDKEQNLGLVEMVPKIVSSCNKRLCYLSDSKMRIYPHTPLYKIAASEGKLSDQTNLLQPLYYENGESNFRTMVTSLVRVSCAPISAVTRLKTLTQ